MVAVAGYCLMKLNKLLSKYHETKIGSAVTLC